MSFLLFRTRFYCSDYPSVTCDVPFTVTAKQVSVSQAESAPSVSRNTRVTPVQAAGPRAGAVGGFLADPAVFQERSRTNLSCPQPRERVLPAPERGTAAESRYKMPVTSQRRDGWMGRLVLASFATQLPPAAGGPAFPAPCGALALPVAPCGVDPAWGPWEGLGRRTRLESQEVAARGLHGAQSDVTQGGNQGVQHRPPLWAP